MDRFLPSLRYLIRLLLKSPGFSVTAVLILAFGIGTNTAIFSLIDAVILRPLPFVHPEQLVNITQTRGGGPGIGYPDFLDLSRSQQSFSSISVSFGDVVDLVGQGDPIRIQIQFTSASTFDVTNSPFVLGRPFTKDEDKPGGPLLVVLTEHFWREHFHGDPAVIGRNLVLSEQSFQVIGVCRQQTNIFGTPGTPPTDVEVPVNVMSVFGYDMQKRDERLYLCIGRLKSGVTVAQAQAELSTIQNHLAEQYPEDKGYSVTLQPLLDFVVRNYSNTIWLLGAAVACLLLICCANISNLLLARSLERRKEMMVRAALGASRFRLIVQVLLETLFLSVLGGAAGLLVAITGIELVKRLCPQTLYRFSEVKLDTTALLFVFGLTAAVSLLAGILPALNISRPRLGGALKDESGRGGTAGPHRQRIQSILIGGQVTLACVLLIGAGLFSRSFQALQNANPGFNPRNLVVAQIYPTAAKYGAPPALRTFFRSVLDKASQLPGVTDAAMINWAPYFRTFGYTRFPFRVEGQPEPAPGTEPVMDSQNIFPDYFKTLQIPFVSGRDFDLHDDVNSARVVIIDEAFAQHLFPGQDPLGKQIIDLGPWDGRDPWTIVGVVKTSHHNSPDNGPAPFQAYFSVGQRWQIGLQFLFLRTNDGAGVLAPEIRKIVASVDPEVPVPDISTFEELMAKHFVAGRLTTLLLSLFSSAALFLSAVGLYGVLTYSVNQRIREVGIRIALGAKPANITHLVMRQGLRIVAIGLAIGLGTGLLVGHSIESLLYGVSGHDPESLLLTVAVLILSAVVACFIPIWRAIRINPITVLRE